MEKIKYQDLILAATNYYNGRPTGMNDETYDKLLLEAKNDNPEFNIFNEITIGTDRQNVKHIVPFTKEEFKEKFKSVDELISKIGGLSDYYPTFKWDGSSIRIYYLDGKLVDIVTRSDEVFGKRKYDQLKNKVPKEVNKEVLCIDCEAVCSKEDFKEDTRSDANGLINSCNMQERVDKYLQLIPFKVTTRTPMDYLEAMKLVYCDDDIKLVDLNKINFDERFIEYKGKHYPIDGFVFYKDTIQNHKIFKHYYNQDLSTEVVDIEWNFTNKLCWVPKVRFNPIYIDGRRVSAATSHGYARLASIKAGIGSEVTVILANSTIPQIHKVLKPSEIYNVPETCKFCGSKMDVIGGRLRCTNDFCSKIIYHLCNSFLVRIGHEYKNTPFNTIEEFEQLLIKDKIDNTLFELIAKFMQSIPIERFKKTDKLINSTIDNLDSIKSGMSISHIYYDCFTMIQKDIFKTYIPIIDKVLQILVRNYDI